MQTKAELAQKIGWEGGLAAYVAEYASRDELNKYDVSAEVKEAFAMAWDAVNRLTDLMEEAGIFDSEEAQV